MILWLVLFLLIVGISFVLALQSMKDYQEIPENEKFEYGLFLIRKPENFNAKLLDSIRELLRPASLIISFERLFKGSKSALTIFGPKKILDKFASELGLLELEDYTSNLKKGDISIWEVGVKSPKKTELESNNIFENLPKFEAEDQFFWQVVLGLAQTQIRAAVYSKDPERVKVLAHQFQNLKIDKLIKIPRPFTMEQMMDFFKLRALSKDSQGPILDSTGIMNLLKI